MGGAAGAAFSVRDRLFTKAVTSLPNRQRGAVDPPSSRHDLDASHKVASACCRVNAAPPPPGEAEATPARGCGP
ncbi:hypothetical protein SBRY_11117 [Actinacidiphila bryophytorum]|uniref:Uncharacterized protein n=1 Tax=Actinacidiphila bryophytorum TaxID=1436133 RepID=A0A9W4GY40_9ACTN|nr:hypothetical protein SBRY_11117 [Actinacidiphila bryophytorum]